MRMIMGFFQLQTLILDSSSNGGYHPDSGLDPSYFIFFFVAACLILFVVIVFIRELLKRINRSTSSSAFNTSQSSANRESARKEGKKVPVTGQSQSNEQKAPLKDAPKTRQNSTMPPKPYTGPAFQATSRSKPSVPSVTPKDKAVGIPEEINLPLKPKELLNPESPTVDDTSIILFTILTPIGWVPQPEPWTYPMVRYPKVHTVIQRPREYRKSLRGHAEANFQTLIEEYFGHTFTISGKHALPTSASSRPYEPDISMVSKKLGANVFLDIEIDEPYAAIKRNPMHCIGNDDMRDVFFVDRGWVVIRFTEKQVATAKNNCLAFIARAIKRLDSSFAIPTALDGVPDPPQENQWSALQAQKWEKENYREGYLGIASFARVALPPNDVALVLTSKEKEVEAKVKPSVIHKGEGPSAFQTNNSNSHPRDKRIQFIPSSHTYLIDGIKADSVTTLIESVFPIFDAEFQAARKSQRTGVSAATYVREWADKGKQSADLGTKLHEEIERFYHQGTKGDSPEFEKFLAFAAAHPNIKLHRSEWRIFDEKALVAGTIDLLSKNPDDTFSMYDWKRSSKVIDAASDTPILVDEWGKTGIGAFSTISDTACNRYFLQQNVYRLILETNYGIKIRGMHLVVIHPDLDRYHKVPVPDWTDHAKMLINSAY